MKALVCFFRGHDWSRWLTTLFGSQFRVCHRCEVMRSASGKVIGRLR